jgi:glycine/D-amino acid oxidase-like deaminating enzyme
MLRFFVFLLVLFPSRTLAMAVSTDDLTRGVRHHHRNQEPFVEAEVVGGAGRIGSLFLSPQARAVPKGIAPGCLSTHGAPIYVTTPAKVWPTILEDTVPDRREDLVWIGNGLPPAVGSVVVPHFGVLEVNADPVTSSESPPTFLYGKHAHAVESILQARGIAKLETLSSYSEIIVAAAQKLLWASSMWLLCHASPNNDDPITALQVHTELAKKLENLVKKELFPALCARIPEFSPDDCDTALDYMYRYSKSMPGAIPNRNLAVAEWKERNAFFLAVRDTVPQPLHEKLLQQVGGISQDDIQVVANSQQQSLEENLHSSQSTRQKVDLPALGLTVVGNKLSSSSNVQTAIVVGGGILGSSVALHLARQGTKVTVVDLQSQKEMGRTTPASWAWLNANGKSPPAYAWLNQLGMDGWRRDPVLSKLPTWSGSLVRFKQQQSVLGGYRCEGPLDKARLQELEPAADLQDESNSSNGQTTKSTFVYYFPDEGLVDPSVAVGALREEATKLGVSFLGHHNVTGFLKSDDRGAILGITAIDAKGETTTMEADVVVLAAGVGSADLGKIPLLHRPGQIALAKPANATKLSLQRIVVDTVRESHILQRQDRTLVVGGGALEVGGEGGAAVSTEEQSKSAPVSAYSTLLGVAQKVVPGVLGDLLRTEQAVRPIPLDGLPAVGFIEPSLYSVVSHSGVTLAPILGALAATEISRGITVEILEPFRPKRFFQP